MNSYIKPPALSTSFSESGKRAKKRFDNILNTKVKKTGVIAFVIIVMLMGIIGTLVACKNSSKDISNLRGEYFDFAIKHRLDYVPVFEEGKPSINSSDYLLHAFAVNLDNWGADKGIMTRKYVEDTIKQYFKVNNIVHNSFPKAWNFDGEKYSAVPSSISEEPIYILRDYKTYMQDGRKIYDITMDECANKSPQFYEDLQRARENIVSGDLSTLSVVGTEKFKFYIENERPIFIYHSILEKTRAGIMNQIPTEALYKYKGTLVGNNSKVSAIVNLLDFTDIPIHSISLQTNNKPYGITINYKVDSRAGYRFFDYSSFNKNAAVMFALIPNAEEIDFRVYDNYSSADNPETSFASAYYSRQNLSERFGMEYFTKETVKDATTNIDTFETYISNVSVVKDQEDFYNEDQKQRIEKSKQIYSVIGDDCEITINSGMQVFITVSKEIAASKKLSELLEPRNIKLGEYIDKKIEFLTYNIRNFKTNQSTDFLFVFDGEKLIAYEELKTMYKDREIMDVLRMFKDKGV